MKLLCPRCSAEIRPTNVNFDQKLCCCDRCDEWFRVSALLSGREVTVRASRPDNSRLELKRDADSLELVSPKGGALAIMFGGYLFLFGAAWIVVLALMLPRDILMHITVVAFLALGLLASVGLALMAYALYRILFEFRLLVNRENCVLRWSVGPLVRIRVYVTAGILGIYDVDKAGGLALLCAEGQSRFGRSLSKNERLWVAEELRDFLKLES